MEVIIKSVDFTAGPELEGFISEKLSKLDKLDDGIIRARVTLHKGQEAVENCHCDVRLEVPGNDHIVKKSHSSFEGAALAVVDTLQDVIKKHKDR